MNSKRRMDHSDDEGPHHSRDKFTRERRSSIDRRDIRDREMLPEVERDDLRRIEAVTANHRGLVAIAETDLRDAIGPSGLVEHRRAPGRALVSAVVEILPDRVCLDQSDRGGLAGK